MHFISETATLTYLVVIQQTTWVKATVWLDLCVVKVCNQIS